MFCQKLFLIQYFDFLCKDIKRNWVSALLSSEMHGLSIGQGLTLLPGVPLNIVNSVNRFPQNSKCICLMEVLNQLTVHVNAETCHPQISYKIRYKPAGNVSNYNNNNNTNPCTLFILAHRIRISEILPWDRSIGYSMFCVGYGIYKRERSSRVYIS